MNRYVDLSLYVLRKAYKVIARKKDMTFGSLPGAIGGQGGSDVIFDALSSGKPCFVGRLGMTETNILGTYLTKQRFMRENIVKNAFNFILYRKQREYPFWWSY